MPVTIRIFNTVATVSDYEWSCEDPEVLDMLSVTLHPFGPSGSDPDPDYTAAQKAIQFFCHGEIIERVKMNREDNAVY